MEWREGSSSLRIKAARSAFEPAQPEARPSAISARWGKREGRGEGGNEGDWEPFDGWIRVGAKVRTSCKGEKFAKLWFAEAES